MHNGEDSSIASLRNILGVAADMHTWAKKKKWSTIEYLSNLSNIVKAPTTKEEKKAMLKKVSIRTSVAGAAIRRWTTLTEKNIMAFNKAQQNEEIINAYLSLLGFAEEEWVTDKEIERAAKKAHKMIASGQIFDNEDLIVQYLGVDKLNSKVTNPHKSFIVTSKLVPYEDETIRELVKKYKFSVERVEKVDFNEKKKLFVPVERTLMQEVRDRNARESLEEQTGLRLSGS
jgi:hypothetical protein